MAIFCLDVELRKRSKGQCGMDDVMAKLYHDHNINSKNPGITHADIKRVLVNMQGGREGLEAYSIHWLGSVKLPM